MLGVSTITPCHGRVSLIEKMLCSLEASRRLFHQDSETILIDSSEPAEAARIEALCKQFGAMYIKGPVSVREKRNLGIKRAKYDVILFIDSDCEAKPNLIQEHFDQYTAYPHISGVLGLTRFVGPKTWVWSVLKYTSLMDSFSFAEKYPYAMWGPTANLSLKKDIIEKAGFFKTNLPFRLGGDDLDLTLRITEHGFYIKCNPNAIVFHTTETWNKFKALTERSWRWGRMEYHNYKNHPQLMYNDFPKSIPMFLLWAILGIVMALIKTQPLFLVLPIVWIVINFFMETGLWAYKEKYPFGRDVILASILNILYQAGTLVEFLKHKDFQFITKRTVFAAGQIIGEWDRQIIRVWSYVIASIIMMIVVATIV
jgi:glycosyltransferase involved in cell wall biosynthesis